MKNNISNYISPQELKLISNNDRQWLSEVFQRYEGYPDLNQLWSLMNEPWNNLGCNPNFIDTKIDAYYAHPVWLLNGLFIEQHYKSLENRSTFKDWVVGVNPSRLAEFGGGFGGLARLIGGALPALSIDIVEPHPHLIAIERANKTSNVRYKASLEGNYDVIIATDVFEHVPDPLKILYETSQHLKIGGKYLIANCFLPVIHCHLPQTFHFRNSWDIALKAMGMIPAEKVAYGRVYIRGESLNIEAARHIENISVRNWKYLKYVPFRLANAFTKVFFNT